MKKLSLLIASCMIAFSCYCQDLTLTLGSGGTSNLAFGDTLVGYPKTLTVELQNSGGTDEGVTISSANSCFTVTPSTVTVSASGSATFAVTFTPDTSATETDTIVFANGISNDTVIVSGTGYYQAAEDAGGSLELYGSDNDYINCGNNIDLANKSFSIDFWFKRSSIGTNDYIIGLGDNFSTDMAIHIGFRSTNYFTFAFYSDDINTYTTYTDLEWHHWAVTYDASTNLKTIYRDGIVAGSGTGSNDFLNTEGDPFWIGRGYNGNYADGQIDELRVWYKVLSQEEIRSQYGSLTGNEDGLTAYYRFDESEGNYVYDLTGNGNTGEFVHSPTRINSSTASIGDPVMVAVLPDSIDFNKVAIPYEDTVSFTVSNTGKGFVNLDFTNSLSNFTIEPSSLSVYGGDSSIVNIIFEPDTAKLYSDKIYYSGNVAEEDSITISGTGIYNDAPTSAGYAIALDGSNDFVNIPDNDNLDMTTNYTIEAWIKPESFGWLKGIVSKYQTSGAYGYLLRLTNTSPYTGLCFDEMYTKTGILEKGKWYHVAAVNDNGVRHLYLNGIEQALSGSALSVKANSNSVKIGCDYNNRYFDGNIDEVRIWNKALTKEEIQGQYSPLIGNEENLVVYFRFDEEDGYAYDATGHNGVATLYNGATRVASEVQLGEPKITSNLPKTIDFGFVPASSSKTNTYSIVNSGKGILNLDFSDSIAPYYVSPVSIGVVSGDTATINFSLIPDSTGNCTDTIIYTGNVDGREIIVNGSSVIQVPEDAGNAMEFDGTDDYISFEKDLSSLTDFTLEQWIYIDNFKNYARTFDFGSGTSNNMLLAPSNGTSGIPAFEIRASGTKYRQDANSKLTTGCWHHIAVTLSGTTLSIYIDGVLDVQNTSYNANPSMIGATTNNWMGRSQYSADAYFDGKIDETRIWNRALTQEEIRSQYGSLTGNEEGLYAYWRFDEEGSDYTIDATGNGNTGVLKNGTSREIPSTAPVAEPVYQVIPDSISFGVVPLTNNSTLPVQIINAGGGILHIENATADSSYLTISPATENILNGDTVTFTAKYTPDITGSQAGYYTFEHNVGTDSVYAEGFGISASSITTVEVVDVFETSVSISVNIDSIGEPNTGYGLCWNTTGTPITADSIFDNGPAAAKGLDTLSMTGLEPATTYFVRAFISNGSYVSYGSEIEVKTYGVPVLNSVTITDITDSTANCNFRIANTGNPALTSYGVCWGTAVEPTLVDSINQVDVAADTGSYTLSVEELLLGSTYFVRAYAITSADTVYSEEVSFLANNAVFSAPDTVTINVPIATTGNTEFTIFNAGDVAMNIYSITSDLDYFSATAINSNIETGDSGKISLHYTAPDTEAIYGNIIITSNAGTDTVLVEGTAYQQAADNAGNAMKFDGSNDYIKCGIVDLYNTSFSVDCWAKKEGNNYLMSLGEAVANHGIHIGFSSNKFRFGFSGDDLTTSTTYTDTYWHHWVATYDIDTKLMTVYCDGQFVESRTASTGYTYTSDATLYIGTYFTNNYFNGQIDELRIWNKALTQDEIRSQYGSLAGNEDGLVAYYRFDESETDSTFDATGNHNSGYFVNGASRVIPSTAPVGEPELTFVQDSLDFGTVSMGNSANRIVKVVNTGSGILNIDSIAVDTVAFAVASGDIAVMSKDTVDIVFTFEPESAGYYSDYFVFGDNAEKTDSIKAVGYYVELPIITDIAMSEIAGTSATVLVTIDPIGAPNPQQYGLCWNTTGLTSIDDDSSDEGTLSTAGTYTLTSSGLRPITTYHIRSYVINGSIVTYSDELTFTTIKRSPIFTWETPADITYGTVLSSEQLSATVDVDGSLEFSPVVGTMLEAGDNQELSVTFTPAASDSVFEGSATVNINVAKAALSVTANDVSRAYGEENPVFALTYSGFVNGEDESVLDTEPTATSAATAASEAGTYDIVVSGGSDNNYEMSYTNGTLTITPLTSVDVETFANISVYPNPVSDKLTVSMLENSGVTSYTLYSITGKIVTAGTVENGKASIDMSQLNSGLYFLNLVQDNKEMNYKIVKE